MVRPSEPCFDELEVLDDECLLSWIRANERCEATAVEGESPFVAEHERQIHVVRRPSSDVRRANMAELSDCYKLDRYTES